jgi:hypothetical protein
MSRHCINTNARALQGASAFVRVGGCMTPSLRVAVFTAAGLRSPGEGDVASP